MASKWVKFEREDKELWNIQNVFGDKKHLKEMQDWIKAHKEPWNSTKKYNNLHTGDAEISMNVAHLGISGKRVQKWEDACSK